MPRGAVSGELYSEMSRTWFKGPLMMISNETERTHTSIFYHILSPDEDRMCDSLGCSGKNLAVFMQHEVDHEGQIFVTFMCVQDAPPRVRDLIYNRE
jgi:hypothetical protein